MTIFPNTQVLYFFIIITTKVRIIHYYNSRNDQNYQPKFGFTGKID